MDNETGQRLIQDLANEISAKVEEPVVGIAIALGVAWELAQMAYGYSDGAKARTRYRKALRSHMDAVNKAKPEKK